MPRLIIYFFFLTGNFAKIHDCIIEHQRKLSNVAAFFNVNLLTPFQQFSLREELGIDIYDRYVCSVSPQILHISGRLGKKSKESPVVHLMYANSNYESVHHMVRYMLVLLIFKQHARTREAKLQTSLAELMYIRQRMKFYGSEDALVNLDQREAFLKRELEDIITHRRQLRRKRSVLQLPVSNSRGCVSIYIFINIG